MNPEIARKLLARLVCDHAPSPPATLHRGLLLVDQLGFDSIGLMELAVALEDELDVDLLQDPQAKGLRTVGQLEDLVVQAVEKQNGQ